MRIAQVLISFIFCSFYVFVIFGQRCAVLDSNYTSIPPTPEQLNPRTIHEIQVVFHIVYTKVSENIPNVQIYSQMDVLNYIFNEYSPNFNNQIPEIFRSVAAKPQIRFCLAKKDPLGLKTNGILRVKTTVEEIGCRTMGNQKMIMASNLGGSQIWDPKKYLNVFIGARENCPRAEAIFPWNASLSTDGIILDPRLVGVQLSSHPFHLGYTLVHELGHYFGLLHLSVNSQPDDCSQDDGIADTPPQSKNYFGCPVHPSISCGQPSMFMNFMSLVQDDCMHLFTVDQVQKMNENIVLYRSELGECLPVIADSAKWVVSYSGNHFGQWIVGTTDESPWSAEVCLIDIEGKIRICNQYNQATRTAFPKKPLQLSPGIYFIQFRSDLNHQTYKIVYY